VHAAVRAGVRVLAWLRPAVIAASGGKSPAAVAGGRRTKRRLQSHRAQVGVVDAEADVPYTTSVTEGRMKSTSQLLRIDSETR
jgi:hypothetical protein